MRTPNVRGRTRAIFALIVGALFTASLWLVPTSASADGAGATVSGHVSLAPSGQSAVGGEFLIYYTCDAPEVTGETCESTTVAALNWVDSYGNFTIGDIQGAGHYTFYVVDNYGGFATAHTDVEIDDPNGSYTGVDFTLQPNALITGRVNLGSSDNPAAAGSVRVLAVQYPDSVSSGYPGDTDGPIFNTLVQTDGSYEFGVAPGYYYRLEFLPIGSSVYPDAWWTNSAPGDTSRDAAPIPIASAGASVTADMTIPVGATISGTVSGTSFYGPYAQIVVYDASYGRQAPGYGYEYQYNFDSYNPFTLGPLLPGSYHVVANPDDGQPTIVGAAEDAYQPRDFDLAASETVSGVPIQLQTITEAQSLADCGDCGPIFPLSLVQVQWDNPVTGQWEDVPANPTTGHDLITLNGIGSDLIPGTYRFFALSPYGALTYGSPFSVSDGSQLLVPFTFSLFPRDVDITARLADSGLREDYLGPGSSAIAWLTMQPSASPDSSTYTVADSSAMASSSVRSTAKTLFPRPWYLEPLG